MAENKEKEEKSRLCKCETPNKQFNFKACDSCWVCGTCGSYGGCSKIGKFIEGLFKC